MSENLQQRVAAAGSSAPSYGVDKKDYVFFKYAKCDCIGYKQLRSLRRRGEACPEHGRRRKPSQLLLQVRSAMQAAVPDLGPVVLEACLLPGSSKPFDMWLPKWHIAVEVDGKQHFRRSMHSKAAQQQYQRDRAVDADCRKQRLRLVRCHYEDDKQWGSKMQQAVDAVKANPHCSFIYCTGSYAFEARVHSAQPTL